MLKASASKSLLKLLASNIYVQTLILSVLVTCAHLSSSGAMRHWNWNPGWTRLMSAYDPQTRKNNREVGCLKRSRLRRWINKTIFSTSKQWRYWESNTGAQPPKFRPRWQIMLFESRHCERNKSAPALIVTRFIVLWLMEGGGGGVLWDGGCVEVPLTFEQPCTWVRWRHWVPGSSTMVWNCQCCWKYENTKELMTF